MPIYQYQCTECHHQLEALQKISEPKLVDCPACAAPALRKQVTAARFKLKGTGWYETDFKNSGKPPAAKPDQASNSDAIESSKSESAPAKEKTQSSTTKASDASV